MCGCCPPPAPHPGKHPALAGVCFGNCGLPGDQCACYRERAKDWHWPGPRIEPAPVDWPERPEATF